MNHGDGDHHDGQYNGDGDHHELMCHTMSLLCECRSYRSASFSCDYFLEYDITSRTIPLKF
jgi:hypothetical protein